MIRVTTHRVIRPQYYEGMKTKTTKKSCSEEMSARVGIQENKPSIIFQRQVYMSLSANSDFIDKRETSNLMHPGYTKLLIWYNKRNCY